MWRINLLELAVRTGWGLVEAVRLISLTIVGDVVYAMIPLLVLAVVKVLRNDSFEDFMDLKEWSFATIVFFGAALRRFVRLKYEQGRDSAHKLELGIQLFIVGLIGSVTVLTLVILEEGTELAPAVVHYLGLAQLSLFATGLLSLLVCVWVEENEKGAGQHVTP
jgi:hypothetical protein